MKAEVDLDLSKIDYDSLNKVLKNKVEELDVKKFINVEKVATAYIKDEIRPVLYDQILTHNGSIEYSAREKINNLVNEILKDLINERVLEIFNSISKEDMDDIIMKAISSALLEVISTKLSISFEDYKFRFKENIENDLFDRIRRSSNNNY